MQRIEDETFDELSPETRQASSARSPIETSRCSRSCRETSIPPMWTRPSPRADMFHKVVAHGMWGGVADLGGLGTELPGPGTIYVDQSLHFHRLWGSATASP